MNIRRMLALLLTLLSWMAVSVPRIEAAPPGHGTYIVVLRKGPQKFDESDIVNAGGKLVGKWDDRHVITIPPQAMKALSKHAAILFVQRVWMGEPLNELAESNSGGLRQETTAEETIGPDSMVHWSSGNYLYDGSGNIKQIGNDKYAYDSAGRLIKASVESVEEKYGYDSFGNLTEKSRPGSPVVLPPVDPASNRISGFDYDVAGNVTFEGIPGHVYDPLNMLVLTNSGSLDRRFLYTADDERIGMQYVEPPEVTRWTIRDFDGHVVREYFGGPLEPTWMWVEDYMYRDGQLAAGNRMDVYGGQRHFHLDHLGTPRVISKWSGLKLARHDYFPFGIEKTFFAQEATEHNYERPDPMAFTGHQRDFLGFYDISNENYIDYMHARYYHPQLGRFLSPDPALGNLLRPGSWNRYAYVMNSPTNYVDPDGMKPIFSGEITVIGAAPWDPGFRTYLDFSAWWNACSLCAGGPTKTYTMGGQILDEAFNARGFANTWTDFVDFVAPDSAEELAIDLAMAPLGPLGKVGKAAKPALSSVKAALRNVHAKVGKLPKGKPGKFGSPQAGTSKKGYRLDPPSRYAPAGSPESKWHINYWDYTQGKRGAGGFSGAIPIE